MDVNETLRHIFGTDIEIPNKSTSSAVNGKTQALESVYKWVLKELQKISPDTDKSDLTEDARSGRLGPPNVRFDITSHVGLFVVGSDRLSVNSQSNFSTIRANTCVYKGKWQYEIQLGSKGVMQVGWATLSCKFSQEIGVGDTSNSYAYDGNRIRKWNVSTFKYGDPWLSGDIIGCLIDLDNGVIEFYRNGRSMGEAFTAVRMGPGIAYFPAVSLAFTENLVANFGSTPFRYPVKGYQPLQEAPNKDVAKGDLICNWLYQLLLLYDRRHESDSRSDSRSSEESVVSDKAFLLAISRILIQFLSPLVLSPYITEACIVPLMEKSCHLSHMGVSKNKTPTSKKSKLINLLDLFWAFLEDFELRKCLESVVASLLTGFRHVSFVLDYPHQKRSLLLLTYISQHPQTRKHLLEHVLFDKVRFANFVHVKPLDEGGLAEIVNEPWWDSEIRDEQVDIHKLSYFAACNKIKEAVTSVETLQIDLLKSLMDNNDGTANLPSSRKLFLRKFRTFLHENFISSKTMPLLQTPLPITLCCFHRILATFRILWEEEVDSYPVIVPSRVFYDGTVNYYNIDRLGGVVSHLNKALRNELITALGADHEYIVSAVNSSSQQDTSLLPAVIHGPGLNMNARIIDGNTNFMIPVLARMITQQQIGVGPMLVERISGVPLKDPDLQEPKLSSGPANPKESLIELLDGLVLFYHISAHKQISKVSTLRESMVEFTVALSGTKERLKSMKPPYSDSDTCIVNELTRSCEVFESKLQEQARHMAWVRAAVYSPEKQNHLAWLLRVVLQTLRTASAEGELFAFVPDYYLDALVEICSALRLYIHPTAPLEDVEDYEGLLIEVAEFLSSHFADPRIVHASSKDTLIQAIASFVCSPNTLQALEQISPDMRSHVVKNLLRPYENRAWAQSNWVLVRFWQGCGFAFRYQKSPHLLKKMGPKLLQTDSSLINQTIKPCPSVIFQNHVREIMLSDEPLAAAFLNSVLNQLNWAFSEFIGMLQEIQNVSSRPERVFIESRQLRICATCFDLALGLLRVLEMISNVAQEVFTISTRRSADMLLFRLCQLLCQILNRVSSQAGCFQHVVSLEIPDLETVDHFPILAAVIGILLAILKDELLNEADDDGESIPRITKSILSEPSFQLNSLNFVLGNLQKGSLQRKEKIFSFQNYSDDVSPEELDNVKHMILYLESRQHRLADVKDVSDDDLCPICYAFPISATFKPCNHQSCRSCIEHHLMNSTDCFFCKSPIQQVVGSDGEILHDLLAEDAANSS